MDGDLNVHVTMQLLCVKKLYLVVDHPLQEVCKLSDVTKNEFLSAVSVTADSNHDGCWIADVDLKSMTTKYSVPGPSLGMNSRATVPHGIDRNGMSMRKTQSEAVITLCMHLLYNGRWKNARPNYFMKFLKNTKELLILVPANKKQSAEKALAVYHPQKAKQEWKLEGV
jgi:hypothetical protein